ncbi:hypothetical protein IC617_08015 [Neiella sp. HB171785]|uniref:Uncharacterized protein n=1 Tax=Neiella litorisoli TaxID=2771431 RepID=A0A8J6QUQ9_9GAMM|nr:hypothetical protein [Neiella litorisoli]MBD1389368.1 hypothetical protein [Neiella litorisoli]
MEFDDNDIIGSVNEVSYLEGIKARERFMQKGWDLIEMVRLSLGQAAKPALRCHCALDDSGQVFKDVREGFRMFEHPDGKQWAIKQDDCTLHVWWRSELSDDEWIYVRTMGQSLTESGQKYNQKITEKINKGYTENTKGAPWAFNVWDGVIKFDIPF